MKKLIALILALITAAAVFPGCSLLFAVNDQKAEEPVVTAKPEPVQTTAPATAEPEEIIREEIVLTKENFDEYINGELPILVDFWADWCGPCMKLAPTVEEIAAESDGSYLVGKVNIDEQPELAARFGVNAIPTVIVFQNGKEIKRSVGLVSKEALLDLLK